MSADYGRHIVSAPLHSAKGWKGWHILHCSTLVKGWHSLCRCFVAMRLWKLYCLVCERIHGARSYSLLLWYIWKLRVIRAQQVIHCFFVGRFRVVHFGLLVPVPVPVQSVLGLAGPGGPQMNSKVCFQKCTIQKQVQYFSLFSVDQSPIFDKSCECLRSWPSGSEINIFAVISSPIWTQKHLFIANCRLSTILIKRFFLHVKVLSDNLHHLHHHHHNSGPSFCTAHHRRIVLPAPTKILRLD